MRAHGEGRLLLLIPLILAGVLPVRAEAPGHATGETPDASGTPRVASFLSKTYLVDRKYKSMLGPESTQAVFLMEVEPPELLWVTGFAAVMVGPDGQTPASQEFMCHSNLDLNMGLHRRLFDQTRVTPNRIFTLSQGQQQIELPAGFGIPVMSSEPFRLGTQVLNHNLENPNIEVRHKVTVEFVRERDLRTPIKPLFQLAAVGMVLVDGKDPYFGIPDPNSQVHGPGCLVGTDAQASGFKITDEQGRRFSGHWTVKPGRQVNHANITRYMEVPFDTTIHYIAVHLHPFAESLELRDLTADKTVYLSKVRPSPGRIGIDHVDYFTSAEGIPIYKDHEYEMVSIYNNTSGEDQDSMAVMYMYLLDKQYKRPQL
ncbi:MAG TPA: hypothetical protein VGK94_15345 [Candidatus Polarisedimenticolia bacterium]|jgi:hypothetical protein